MTVYAENPGYSNNKMSFIGRYYIFPVALTSTVNILWVGFIRCFPSGRAETRKQVANFLFCVYAQSGSVIFGNGYFPVIFSVAGRKIFQNTVFGVIKNAIKIQ